MDSCLKYFVPTICVHFVIPMPGPRRTLESLTNSFFRFGLVKNGRVRTWQIFHIFHTASFHSINTANYLVLLYFHACLLLLCIQTNFPFEW